MYKIQVRGRVLKSKLEVDSQEFNNLISMLDDGNCIVSVTLEANPKTVEDYRAHYFALRDIVAEATGNTKKDIHEGAKRELLNGESTKILTEESWKKFIKDFQSWSYEIFNIFI